MKELSFEELKRIKNEFQRKYLFNEPFLSYFSICGISKIGDLVENSPNDEKDNFCIHVGLERALPAHLSLPFEYENIRVIVEVVGKIYAQ